MLLKAVLIHLSWRLIIYVWISNGWILHPFAS